MGPFRFNTYLLQLDNAFISNQRVVVVNISVLNFPAHIYPSSLSVHYLYCTDRDGVSAGEVCWASVGEAQRHAISTNRCTSPAGLACNVVRNGKAIV